MTHDCESNLVTKEYCGIQHDILKGSFWKMAGSLVVLFAITSGTTSALAYYALGVAIQADKNVTAVETEYHTAVPYITENVSLIRESVERLERQAHTKPKAVN